MPMYLYLGDITRMETDAIVNAAGTDLRRCPGICDAIFAAADTEELERACRKLGRCRIGQAVATPGCGLPCRYIIHVAGPGWYGGEPRERFLLAGCYQNALHKAYLCSCRRGAVPLIFSGDCHIISIGLPPGGRGGDFRFLPAPSLHGGDAGALPAEHLRHG